MNDRRPRCRGRLLLGALLAASLLATALPLAAQVPPSALRLQGYLTDQTVDPAVPAQGPVAMTFSLWDQAMGGSQLASEALPSVDVVDGLYDVTLPFGPGLFEGPRWLEITVAGEVLAPRLAIESTPFAYLAGRAQVAAAVDPDGVDTDALQDEVVTLDKLALACAPGDILARTATGWGCFPFLTCPPGTVQPCYTGPDGTEGVGACMAGTTTCQPDGTAGACDGQVLPMIDVCGDAVDADCDGSINDGTDATAWFQDGDGDGFGTSSSPTQACTQPSGFVSNSLDCFDGNADARPGQTQFFEVDRGDGSFDYDCNGSLLREFPSSYSCSGLCSSFSEGWISPTPGCGQFGTLGLGCDTVFPSSCEEASAQTRQQACR